MIPSQGSGSGLNKCLSPSAPLKLRCWSSTHPPGCNGTQRWSLGRWLGLEGGSPGMGLVLPEVETKEQTEQMAPSHQAEGPPQEPTPPAPGAWTPRGIKQQFLTWRLEGREAMSRDACHPPGYSSANSYTWDCRDKTWLMHCASTRRLLW